MPQPPPAPVLQVRRLCFAYPDQAPLFVDWHADLPPGVTLLSGESGSGKTTLLRLLAGELTGSGELTLRGRHFSDGPAAYRQAVCAFDPRDEAFDALTPVGLMAAQRERHPDLDEATWQRHVAGFELAPHLAKPLYALSTGSRRKAGLAVALAASCALTLLDEPVGGLDGPAIAYLTHALAAAGKHGQRALLLVSSLGLNGLPLAGTITLPGPANG
jgi:ABC-2 type transport system ATP-binding protein